MGDDGKHFKDEDRYFGENRSIAGKRGNRKSFKTKTDVTTASQGQKQQQQTLSIDAPSFMKSLSAVKPETCRTNEVKSEIEETGKITLGGTVTISSPQLQAEKKKQCLKDESPTSSGPACDALTKARAAMGKANHQSQPGVVVVSHPPPLSADQVEGNSSSIMSADMSEKALALKMMRSTNRPGSAVETPNLPAEKLAKEEKHETHTRYDASGNADSAASDSKYFSKSQSPVSASGADRSINEEMQSAPISPPDPHSNPAGMMVEASQGSSIRRPSSSGTNQDLFAKARGVAAQRQDSPGVTIVERPRSESMQGKKSLHPGAEGSSVVSHDMLQKARAAMESTPNHGRRITIGEPPASGGANEQFASNSRGHQDLFSKARSANKTKKQEKAGNETRDTPLTTSDSPRIAKRLRDKLGSWRHKEENVITSAVVCEPTRPAPLQAVLENHSRSNDVFDAVNVQILVPDDETVKRQKRRLIRKGTLCAVAAIVLAVILAGVGVGVSRRRNPPTTFEMLSRPPTFAPTTDRTAEVMEFIINSGVSTEDEIYNRTTPQNKAARWIGQDDEMALDPGNDPSVFLQRYIMAVLYFSTNGNKWSRCSKDDESGCTGLFDGNGVERTQWLSGSTECHWFAIFCDSTTNMITDMTLDVEFGLVGVLPKEMENLESLRQLSAPGNRLQGSLPSWISRLPNLATLRLYANEFSGTLSDELFEMTQLEFLSISDNRFTGAIPGKISNLSSLHFMGLGENKFNGTIPDSLSSMDTLRALWINGNELTGDLPESIYVMSNLREINVAKNQLMGTISAEVAALSRLSFLDLSENVFTGFIPSDLGSIASLKTLRLEGNELRGTMPSSVCSLTSNKLKDLAADCNPPSPEVAAKVVCSCCTECDAAG